MKDKEQSVLAGHPVLSPSRTGVPFGRKWKADGILIGSDVGLKFPTDNAFPCC